MPLSDWLGASRQEGFIQQLYQIAAQMGLRGEIDQGIGYFLVSRGADQRMMTIRLENGDGVVARIFSDVHFPPGRIPREVVVSLMDWRMAAYLGWDGYSNSDCSCVLIRFRINLHDLSAAFLTNGIDEALIELAALDERLKQSGYGQLDHRAPKLLDQPRSLLTQIKTTALRLLRGPS